MNKPDAARPNGPPEGVTQRWRDGRHARDRRANNTHERLIVSPQDSEGVWDLAAVGDVAEGGEAACWEMAARVRADHPGWVVIWSPFSGEFQARPLFRAPSGTVAAGRTPADLIAQMNIIRAAAPHRAPALSPPGRVPGPASPSADPLTTPESS